MELNQETIELFDKLFKKRQAVTFDEVTLEDKPSNFHPNMVNLDTNITPKIRLKSGILSSAMDTVTERDLALALAKMGGIGIIHKNLTPTEQKKEVRWVRNKIHYETMIENPVTFGVDERLSDMERCLKEKGYTFTNFPIIDKDGNFVGMVGKDETQFAEQTNPTLGELMIPLAKLVTATSVTAVGQQEAYEIMKKNHVKKLPIIDKDNHLIGLYTWNDVRKDINKNNLYSLDDEGHFLVGAAIGIGKDEELRVDKLMSVGCKLIVIDTSHGACEPVLDILRYIKTKYKDQCEVVVGNIASYDSAKYLLQDPDCLPDALKTGISVGSICTTRLVTGHGMPQLSAVYQTCKAVREMGYNIPIIADGGIRYSSDIVKVLAAGASGVMMGNIFAGTDESPGKLVTSNGQKYKVVRGMGSKGAMEDRIGSRERYFGKTSSKVDNLTRAQSDKVVPEGVEGFTKYRGSVEKVVNELTGGVKAGLAHSGADNIQTFRQNATFWLQSSAGAIEGNPHGLVKIID
jgi:IMP dehydrogenase